MNEVKSRMQRLNGQEDEQQPLTPTPLPKIPFGRSENGRAMVSKDRELPLRNVFRFRDLKIQGFISEGKDRISYTNPSKQMGQRA